MAAFIPLLFCLIITVNYTTVVAQNPIQTSDFIVFQDLAYMSSVSYNLIANIQSKVMSSIADCAHLCLTYTLCQTATYYIQTQTCAIYREKYGLGRLINVGGQTASTISLNYISPAVTYCASYSLGDFQLLTNQFIYSPNELYAFGVSTNTWGIYNANPNGSIASIFWQPPGTIAIGSWFSAQNDGNLVVYSPSVAWTSSTQSAGSGAPYCLFLLNAGQVVWLDSTNTTVWHS